MSLIKSIFFNACVILVLFSCKNNENKTASDDTILVKSSVETPVTTSKSTNCYLSTFHRDTTFVSLTKDGDSINGTMNWIPYQKDGARGTLAGRKNSKGEFELLYSYMIEGNNQTETKVMKIENDKLLIKVGELIDPKNDGHLIIKDVNTATYKDTLTKVDCK